MIASIHKYLFFFNGIKQFIGIKIYKLISFTMFVSLVDGIGLMLFIPLLESKGTTNILLRFISINFIQLLILIGIIFSLKGLLGFFYLQYLTKLTFTTEQNLRAHIFNTTCEMNFLSYQKTQKGYFNNLLTVEIPRVATAINSFSSITTQILSTIVYTIISLIINPTFTLFAIVVAAILATILKYFQNKTAQYSKHITTKNAVLNGLIIHCLKAMKYIKATKLTPVMTKKLDDITSEILSSNKIIGTTNGIISSIIEPIAISILLISLYVQVEIGKTPISMVLIGALIFYKALSSLLRIFPSLQYFNSLYGSVDAVLRAYNPSSNSVRPFVIITKHSGDVIIELNNLSFSYLETPNVIENYSKKILRNTITGITGPVGSGKSTFLNLISGLLKPQNGFITVSSSNIGYVTQENIIFNDTIFNNITLWGQHSIKPMSLICLSFLNHFPERLETFCEDDGNNFSGGQRQLIALAREINRRPDILLLDEPVNAIDAKTIDVITSLLLDLKKSTTIIITSHDAKLLSICDTIISLK